MKASKEVIMHRKRGSAAVQFRRKKEEGIRLWKPRNLSDAMKEPPKLQTTFALFCVLPLFPFFASAVSAETRDGGEPHPSPTSAPPTPPEHLAWSALDTAKKFFCLRSLCKNRPEKGLQAPEQMLEIDFNRYLCYCDAECHIFQDCCADLIEPIISQDGLPYENSTASAKTTVHSTEDYDQVGYGVQTFRDIPYHRWGCYELSVPKRALATRMTQGAYLVDKCPDDYGDVYVITRCSNRHLIPEEEYSHLLDLPVVSSLTGIAYLNSFCMSCNEKGMDQVDSPFYPMTLRYKCTAKEPEEEHVNRESLYMMGQRLWKNGGQVCILEIADYNKVFFGTGEDVDPNRPGNYTRKCLPVEDECEDENMSKMCSAYSLYVRRKSSTGKEIYKNPHCAFCQGIPKEDLECRPVAWGRSRVPLFRLPKLSQIFEIKWGGGGAVGGGPMSAGKLERCPALHVWDFVGKKCVVVGCGIGEMHSGGKCEAYAPQTSEAYPWNSTCGSGNTSGSDPECSGQGGNTTTGNETMVITDIHALIQGYLILACLSISVFCLIIHIVTYSLLPQLRNLPGRNLLAMSWALLAAQSTTVISGINIDGLVGYWFCVSAAVIMYFFYLSAVFWMNVMSVDVWRTFSSSSSSRHQIGGRDSSRRMHLRYSAYAWGVPLLFTVLTVLIDNVPVDSDSALALVQPRYGLTTEGVCWFNGHVGAAIFFTVPTIVLLLANACLFARSVFKIHENQESRRYMRKKAMEEESLCNQRISKAAESEDSANPAEASGMVQRRPARRGETITSCITSKDKSRLYLYVKLATIMGLSWICGFIAGFTQSKELWYPFIILNGLQGAFIFFMFDVKWKVIGMLVERITGRKPEWTSYSVFSSNWPLNRNRKSWGTRERSRKSKEYVENDLTKSSSEKYQQGSSTRTTSTSIPSSSDIMVCSLPEGQTSIHLHSGQSDLKRTTNL